MRLLAILLGCLQLSLLVLAVREDEQLFEWHEFHLSIEDSRAAEAVHDYSTTKDFLIANEDHRGFAESVVVPPTMAAQFANFLTHQGVTFEVKEKDVGGMLLRAKLDNLRSAVAEDPSTFFAQTSIIYDWIDEVVKANSDIASTEDIGTSYEGRRLVVLKLSNNGGASRPVIFIDAAIHAREWLAPATVNYVIKQFIADIKGGNAEVKALLDKYDWHFMPVLNPDGYDYTFRSSSTRYWRKTRKPYGAYYGADPNRNFDFMFGGAGTSNNPSSDIYHGPNAFSEPETKALSVYLTRIQSRLTRGMYISFHTYGQWWLTPPGYTRTLPADHTQMVAIGNVGNAAITAAGGPAFRVGQPANVGLYEAAGGSYDWVKFRANVKYSFTLELRPAYDGSLAGFSPSASLIPTSGREIYAALKAVAKADKP